ncbi:hypothetical protein [Actinacidiphila paucisporea]|uniref:hypothetical protein n=1 Tax=Actinacidiphila paucisporea TaxID=310782 RepID=UPI0013565450|nr:hypothetical protein [Actinacidiphila paucisporea]
MVAVHVVKNVVASVLMVGGLVLSRREWRRRTSCRGRRLGLSALGLVMCWCAVMVSQS